MDFIQWIRQDLSGSRNGRPVLLPVQQMQQYLESQYQQLQAKEKALECREKRVAERELGMTARARELNQMKQTVAEGLDQLRREREQTAAESGAGRAAVPAEELQEVKRQFMNIGRELQQTREKLLQLNETVNSSCDDGVAMLCELHRELSFSGDPRLRLYADRLGRILRLEFQAESLLPLPGDRYDSIFHERVDAAQPGDTVLRCRLQGWRRNGEVLMRAVVETREGSVF